MDTICYSPRNLCWPGSYCYDWCRTAVLSLLMSPRICSWRYLLSNNYIVGVISVFLTVVLYSARVKGAPCLSALFLPYLLVFTRCYRKPYWHCFWWNFSTFGAPFLTDSAGVMGIVKARPAPVLLVFSL